jgi:hypothetical protein
MPVSPVCTVSPQGNVECPTGVDDLDLPAEKDARELLEQQIETAFGVAFGSEKLRLARNLLAVLANSTLPNVNIGNRRLEIVNAVNMLLSPTLATGGETVQPPSILLFNYSTLPAQALGPWILTKQGLGAVQALYTKYDGTGTP